VRFVEVVISSRDLEKEGNMKKLMRAGFVFLGLAIGIAIMMIWYLPTNRVRIHSELVMLGDLNGDHSWDQSDSEKLGQLLENPFLQDPFAFYKADVNRNGRFDDEDVAFLMHIYEAQNPYEARNAVEGRAFPYPRELYRYIPSSEYLQTPLFALEHDILKRSPLSFHTRVLSETPSSPYMSQLLSEIYAEASRFVFAFDMRKNQLSDIERSYVERKLSQCESLYESRQFYELLLELIGLVEDAETLSTKRQTAFIQKILFFRDHLKELLVSEDYHQFLDGQASYPDILIAIESLLEQDLDISIALEDLDSPRDFKDLENYLDRAEWQIYKSATTAEDFKRLVLFAQFDRRYSRAVSKTSPRLTDIQLEHHNLPMILLFREALRITKNKKAAVGLLDEAVRIPMGWVKSIPRDMLPSSIALENFLLPGNMEDGSDKTRHWSVFGGVAIYKSPKESLLLAFKRENLDLKANHYTVEAMNEFIRDMIANLNGIYYVVSIDPDLLHAQYEGSLESEQK